MPTSDQQNPSGQQAAATELPVERLPRHIAIIMDGNGRWAQLRGLPRVAGHRAGAISVRAVITESARLGIECLTLYSFSSENWKRPPDEVEELMNLYAEYLIDERDMIMQNNVRLRQIGRRDGLPDRVLTELDTTRDMSANNTGMTLCLALNYSARCELVDATRAITRKVHNGELSEDQIDEQCISDHLYTAGLPDPDLLVRTAGERRLSNFMLWQVSYAELYVTSVLWPEFRKENLHQAIFDFARRERRFGALKADTNA